MNDGIRLRDGLETTLVAFLVIRLGLFVLSVIGPGLVPLPPGQPTSVPGWPAQAIDPGLGNLFTATERQDALWFLRIAADGYRADDLSAAFFPLYPIAVRALAWLPGIGTLAAALLVSNAAFLGSLVLLHGLVRVDADEETADRAVRLAAVFPTAFFLMAPYSESLFLLLVLAAFWFARRDRWGLVALAGLGAGLTRSVGVVLALALALEALADRPGLRRLVDGSGWLRPLATRTAAAAAPIAGLALYLGGWWLAAGEPLRPLHVQQDFWRPELSAPWSSFARGIEYAVRFDSWFLVDAVFVVGVAVVVMAGARRLRGSYTVYSLASLALPLFATFPGRPFLSMPRFAAVLFPVALVLARQRLVPELAITLPFAVGWAISAVLFVNWQYIF